MLTGPSGRAHGAGWSSAVRTKILVLAMPRRNTQGWLSVADENNESVSTGARTGGRQQQPVGTELQSDSKQLVQAPCTAVAATVMRAVKI